MQHLCVHSLGRVSDPCCLNRRRRARRRRGAHQLPGNAQAVADHLRSEGTRHRRRGVDRRGAPVRLPAAMGWRWCPPRLEAVRDGGASGAGWGACLRDHKSWQAEVPPVRGGTWHRGRTFSLRSA